VVSLDSVRWYEWDPTKWCIWIWFMMGLASNLHRCHPNSVRYAEVRIVIPCYVLLSWCGMVWFCVQLKVKENAANRLLHEIRRQRSSLASWYDYFIVVS
jgi:hypothetical protein